MLLHSIEELFIDWGLDGPQTPLAKAKRNQWRTIKITLQAKQFCSFVTN